MPGQPTAVTRGPGDEAGLGHELRDRVVGDLPALLAQLDTDAWASSVPPESSNTRRTASTGLARRCCRVWAAGPSTCRTTTVETPELTLLNWVPGDPIGHRVDCWCPGWLFDDL